MDSRELLHRNAQHEQGSQSHIEEGGSQYAVLSPATIRSLDAMGEQSDMSRPLHAMDEVQVLHDGNLTEASQGLEVIAPQEDPLIAIGHA